MSNLKINYKNITEIKPYENNPRIHSNIQIEQIVKSIKEFGFTVPILLDEQNNVIAGHGRLEASKVLDLGKVPTITLSNLSEEQKKAYIIADNKITLNSNWNEELLKNELKFLSDNDFSLDVLAFEDSELENYFKDIKEVDFTEDFQEFDEDIETKHQCPKCGFKWSGNAN
tara:strand:+ start:859 stop:1371 length:513 start_codon:yes stop_codon:yes gene_type:complete